MLTFSRHKVFTAKCHYSDFHGCPHPTPLQRNESMVILAVRMEHVSIAQLSPSFPKGFSACHSRHPVSIRLSHITDDSLKWGGGREFVCQCVCETERGTEKDVGLRSDPHNPVMSFKEESAGTISPALFLSFMVQFEVNSMFKLMALKNNKQTWDCACAISIEPHLCLNIFFSFLLA